MNNQGNTGTAKSKAPEKTPGNTEQNPGTSRGQQEDWTGTSEERGQYEQQNDNAVTEPPATEGTEPDPKIRNPSGDDLSNAVRGDEGSGRNR